MKIKIENFEFMFGTKCLEPNNHYKIGYKFLQPRKETLFSIYVTQLFASLQWPHYVSIEGHLKV